VKSIERLPLDVSVHRELTGWQAEIDAITGYAERIDTGSRRFDRRNRADNTAFAHIRDVLDTMCAGNSRRMYCEDSYAYQIEHFWPRSVYADKIFVWSNYLYSCGRCNITKRNNFEIYRTVDRRRIKVTTKHNEQPPSQPAPGEPVLIDPCAEDPADFPWLDMTPGSFLYTPKRGLPGRARARAIYTIDLLGLNKRPELPRGRQWAYRTYCSLLRDFIQQKKNGASDEDLAFLVESLHMQPFQAVWIEMKRQYLDQPRLAELFTREIDALRW
jgi:hypothetical protein